MSDTNAQESPSRVRKADESMPIDVLYNNTVEQNESHKRSRVDMTHSTHATTATNAAAVGVGVGVGVGPEVGSDAAGSTDIQRNNEDVRNVFRHDQNSVVPDIHGSIEHTEFGGDNEWMTGLHDTIGPRSGSGSESDSDTSAAATAAAASTPASASTSTLHPSTDPPETKDDSSIADSDDGENGNHVQTITLDPRAIPAWIVAQRARGHHPAHIMTLLAENFGSLIPQGLMWRLCLEIGMAARERCRSMYNQARKKLADVNTISDVCSLIRKSSNIIVLTGAGISVSSGIPDFRSKGGIYPRLRDEFGLPEPECMFDLEYFHDNPKVFYSFASELWPGNHHPSFAHYFIAQLESRGKLLRNYSQNIDDLEHKAGINSVLQCHGSFATAACVTCGYEVKGSAIHENVMSKTIAYCPLCHPEKTCIDTKVEQGTERPQRIANDIESYAIFDDGPSLGVMKPNIVFFGEDLPNSFEELIRRDAKDVDLVLVMGSSLKVHPVAGVVNLIPEDIPMVLLNKEVVGYPNRFDVEMLGYLDTVCQHLSRELGWDNIMPTDHPLHSEFQTENGSVKRPASYTPSVDTGDAADAAVVSNDGPTSATSATAASAASSSEAHSSVSTDLCQHIYPNRYLFDGYTPRRQVYDSSDSDSNSDDNDEEDAAKQDNEQDNEQDDSIAMAIDAAGKEPVRQSSLDFLD
jgi:NAD-dependent SIR2 family protein deacetylase